MAAPDSADAPNPARPYGPARSPSSVLFACTLNRVRSPMAEALAKHILGRRIFFDSVGVRPDEDDMDPFAQAVMDEIGLDLARHHPKSFDQLEDASFDLVISLTPEAQHRAVELTRTNACELEYWPTQDPTAVSGNREIILDAYRQVRDSLMERIKARFEVAPPPRV